MKYIEPEIEIVGFECDNVITQVSVVPGETTDGVPDVDLENKPF